MYWATHLEHLQAVLNKFNIAATPLDKLLIWYFRNGFRPSILAKLDKQDCDIVDW